MAHSISAPSYGRAVVVPAVRTPMRTAYEILHWGFVALPVIAGADKFIHLLTNWDGYLSSFVVMRSPLGRHGTMNVVGVIEIVAAFIVAVKPKVGAWIVALWLAGIIGNLLLLGGFYDIALRDFGLFLGAIALGLLSIAHDRELRELGEIRRVREMRELP
jgi:hypothetical protein